MLWGGCGRWCLVAWKLLGEDVVSPISRTQGSLTNMVLGSISTTVGHSFIECVSHFPALSVPQQPQFCQSRPQSEGEIGPRGSKPQTKEQFITNALVFVWARHWVSKATWLWVKSTGYPKKTLIDKRKNEENLRSCCFFVVAKWVLHKVLSKLLAFQVITSEGAGSFTLKHKGPRRARTSKRGAFLGGRGVWSASDARHFSWHFAGMRTPRWGRHRDRGGKKVSNKDSLKPTCKNAK